MTETIEQTLSRLLTIDEENYPAALSQAIETCFHLPDAKVPSEQAVEIIEALLKPFSFKKFLKKYVSNPDLFVSALIYGLYFGDYKPQKKHDFYTLLQILSENISQEDLQKAFTKLDLNEQTRLIAHTFANYREGSFLIQREVTHPKLKQLTIGLQREFYSIHKLKALLYVYQSIDEKTLNDIVNALETQAIEESQKVYQLLDEVTRAIINSSTKVYETLTQVKIPGMPPLLSHEDIETAIERKKKLEELFKPYLNPPLTPVQVLHFARIFGLKGNFPFLELECELDSQASLCEKLMWIRDLFSDPFRVFNKERKLLNFYIFFIEALLQQIHSIHHQPELYFNSLKRLIFAMATKGKDLSSQGSLETILDGLRSLTNNLKPISLLVFDQSDASLFSQNAKTINALNEKYQCNITHLSKKEIFECAAKLGIKDLLDTSETGHLGYSGIRNCIFLLSPMINHPLNLQEFDQRVLQETANPIFMFDDDNVFPASNIYCYLMFVHRQKRYSALQCYNTGRYSKLIHAQTFREFMEAPAKSLMHARWIDTPYNATMSEYISKPKVGLNIPLGAEEGYLNFLFEFYPLLKPSIHIPGPRFPKGVLPTRPYMGFEQRLKSYISYAIGVDLVQYLLDPLNKQGDCVFPWNDREVSDTFRSLKQTMQYMATPAIQLEMQDRFWKRLDAMINPRELNVLREHLNGLIDEKIEDVVASQKNLTIEEQKSLREIADIYREYQKDARILLEYGEDILMTKSPAQTKAKIERKHGVGISELALTYSLHLICRRVGTAEFNLSVARIVSGTN